MLRFTDPNTSPPGGNYLYTQLETSYELKSPSLTALLKQIRAHRVANNIPIGVAINQEIENACCKELLARYPNYNGCVDSNDQTPFRGKMNISHVFDFLKTAAVWLAKGAKFVDQAEANRRAEICLGCPKNSDIGNCIPCGAGSLLKSIKGGSTLLDDKLHVCGACGCYLPAKIWFPKEVMTREGVTYQVGRCWMLE